MICLVPALERQARKVGHRTGLNVEILAEESAGELPETHRTCIYRIARKRFRIVPAIPMPATSV